MLYQTSRTFGYPNCYHKQPNEEEDNSHHETGDHKWRKFSRKAPKVWILAALMDILTEREYEYVVCFGRVRSHEGSDSFKPYDQKRKLFIYHPQKSSF